MIERSCCALKSSHPEYACLTPPLGETSGRPSSITCGTFCVFENHTQFSTAHFKSKTKNPNQLITTAVAIFFSKVKKKGHEINSLFHHNDACGARNALSCATYCSSWHLQVAHLTTSQTRRGFACANKLLKCLQVAHWATHEHPVCCTLFLFYFTCPSERSRWRLAAREAERLIVDVYVRTSAPLLEPQKLGGGHVGVHVYM